MKKKAILGIGLSVLATAAAGVALFQWVAQPRYQLGDIYERYYVVENTPVEIEPVTIDLTEYAGAGEDAWENADVPLYSDPHCEIRMTTVRPDGDGTYEVYFLVTNHLEEGIYFTAPERCFFDEAGNHQSEITGRIEMETDQGWLPCFWGAPGGFNEVNEWGIQLYNLEYSEWVQEEDGKEREENPLLRQVETGQVTLRFQGIWQNHWQLKGRAVEEAPLPPLHRGPRPWETELPA